MGIVTTNLFQRKNITGLMYIHSFSTMVKIDLAESQTEALQIYTYLQLFSYVNLHMLCICW